MGSVTHVTPYSKIYVQITCIYVGIKYTWSCQTYNWQLEREEVQHKMRWKMMEEEWS
jgi:hypothetical protein